MGTLMKRSFNLFEMIVVLVIIGFLAVASYKAVETVMIKSFKVKELTRLSLESDIALEQIGSLLSYRVPATTIGYDPVNGDFVYIGDITYNDRYKVLEWLSTDYDDYRAGGFSGFIDMNRSVATQDTLYTDINMPNKECNLIFAGNFDNAYTLSEYKEAFGWHGHASKESFDIVFISDGLRVTDADKPQKVYEKYFLVDQAYAIARAADIDKSASCLQNMPIDDNTLILFFGYKPWKGESFCADPLATNRKGDATILAQYIAGFNVQEHDYSLRIILDINRSIRGSSPLHFSKMKVVF